MTVRQSLLSITPYSLPDATLSAIGEAVGLDINAEVSSVEKKSLHRAFARVYLWLAMVPNISEGGVSISFSQEDKKNFLILARSHAKDGGEDNLVPGATYGYKGERL